MRHSNRGSDFVRASLLVSASVSALLLASPALAQATAAANALPDQQPAPTDDQKQAAQKPPQTQVPSTRGSTAVIEDKNAIVVTGTRIRQPEFTSPDPVARIDPTIAQHEGKLNIADTLQSSPIAAGSTQITSALSSNFVTNGGPGSETIDLRGLGANRTLVLLNGRRAGPAGTRGGVSSFDLNVLPQSIVKQVDILKTGASSIYGSDAVAGVVNLITKTDFNGVEVNAFGNVPFKKGGEEFSASILGGKTFGDRGHIMVALDYYRQNELARGQRSYLDCPPAYIVRPNSKERADLIDPRTGKYHCEDFPGPQVWTYDYEYNYLGQPGNLNVPGIPKSQLGGVVLMQYFPGNAFGLPPISGCGAVSCFNAPPGWLPTGFDPLSQSLQDDTNPYIAEATIIPKTERYTLYADASYEFTDNIEAYAEFLANRRKTYQNGWQQFWTFGYTASGGYCAFYDCYGSGPIPGLGGSVWAKGWTGLNFLSPTGVTDRGADSKQRVDYWRGVGGLRGDLGGFLKGWSYDVYVQYSHNKGLYSSEQLLQDVIDITSFQTASCVGTVTPVSHKQCIDLPWTDPNFLAGHFTPEQADYMFDWQTGKTIYKQISGEASLSGTLLQLPAGPLGVALGATARRDSIVDTPGAITLAGNAWGATSAGVTAGHEITTEAFGEVQVPLLKDKPMFRDLSFSGAARLTNVKAVQAGTGVSESNKGNWTYKLGGNWAVSSWLRFRGTYGTSFRAPALFEEFKSNETSFFSARSIDPCVNWGLNLKAGNIDQRIADNCASQGIQNNYGGGSVFATVFSQGGIGQLEPETSTAKTASIILTPRFGFLPATRLSLAVDYFDITVKGEISQLGPHNIVFGCYDSPSFPTDPICNLFARGETGTDPKAITSVHDKYINIAKQQSRGLDFTALAQQNLGRWGTLTLLGNATLTTKNTFALFADTEEDLLGVINDTSGRTGTERFVGDVTLTWKPRGGWTIFWGANIFGKFSNDRIYKEVHAGSLCNSADPNDPTYSPTTQLYGAFCVRTSAPTVVYHSVSITKEFGNLGLEITGGIRNIFDTRPPQVSTIGGTGLPSTIGPVIGTSQYDFLGRRAFFNITKKF
jgi:iron complex outermembrane receptor protein